MSQATIAGVGALIAQIDAPLEVKQALAVAAGTAIGAAFGGQYGAASGFNATVNNYLTAADLRSRQQKLEGCRQANDPSCEVKVLIEYEVKSATNTGKLSRDSIGEKLALEQRRSELEDLLNDPTASPETKAQARRSIAELNVAINVVEKSPVLKDAFDVGLIAADVLTLGEFAAARTLSATVVKAFVLSKTGTEISAEQSARIANNFYRDGVELPQALATSSGVVIQATPGKTTTVLGNYLADMRGLIVDQTGIPKSMAYTEGRAGGFNFLNVPDDYASALVQASPDAFLNQVNKPFLEQAILRGDEIYLATKPDYRPFSPLGGGNVYRADGSLTGYGRELKYLSENGYFYETNTGKMVKR